MPAARRQENSPAENSEKIIRGVLQGYLCVARSGHDARLSSSIDVARSSASTYDDEASLPISEKPAFAQKLRVQYFTRHI